MSQTKEEWKIVNTGMWEREGSPKKITISKEITDLYLRDIENKGIIRRMFDSCFRRNSYRDTFLAYLRSISK